jgi:hypothetical protein
MVTFAERGKNYWNVASGWAKRNAPWMGRSFYEGSINALGFARVSGPGTPMKFLGGMGVKPTLKALGIGAGVGYGVYKATDNPLLGIGAGAVAMKMTSAVKHSGGLMGFAGRTLGLGFMGMAAYQGYQEGGLGGAARGMAESFVTQGLFNVGLDALKVAFRGSALGGAGSSLMAVAYPLAIAAGIGYGAYKGAQYFAARGRRSMRTEFAGDMTAFQTDAAYTMRQRALQEIQISHTNSRTILGQESQLMHLR